MYFFHRAFRPFFLGATISGVILMLVWWVSFNGLFISDSTPLFTFSGISPTLWHAHEMIFGYALATVVGFLLTAVMNWTGENSASGKPLALLFFLWLVARIGYLLDMPLAWIALIDMIFIVGLFLLFFLPIYRQKQWKQMGLASKFFLLIIANALFYGSSLELFSFASYQLSHQSLVASLFLVLAINVTMLRRLIPFFTEKAIGLPPFKDNLMLDRLALIGFFILLVCIIFLPHHWSVSVLSFALGIVYFIRAKNWYHAKIWGIILLWPLHVSYAFFTFGIFLYGFANLNLISESIALHSLAAGGIGLLCSAILARISLGHSNRNVFSPPKGVVWVFILLTLAALVRVVMPIVFPSQYMLWINLSQWGWILAFMLLTILYIKILTFPPEPKNTGVLL